jgi:GT2 family glycosyltransferase
MVNNPQVFVIILNWNGTKDTTECLQSIINNTYDNYTIILVDNGSSKKSLLELKKWCENNFNKVLYYTRFEAEYGGIIEKEKAIENFPSKQKLIFIENNDNLGFAAGNNIALRYALKKGINYNFLLNNDTVIESNAISKLISFFLDNKEYVGVTSQIRYYEPNNIIWNCGGKIVFPGFRKYYFARKNISMIPQEGFRDVTFVTGCALVIKLKETGLLSEKFFFGEEDFDLSWRLMKNHKKLACNFESIVYHKVNKSINKTSSNFGGIILQYSQRIINLKNKIPKLQWLFFLLLQIGYSIPMMRIRYKYSLRDIFFIWRHVLYYAKNYFEIDKELFKTIIHKE